MANALTPKQKAARKAARTRARNAASMKRWLEVEKPLKERVVALANAHLAANRVRVRFIHLEGGPRLTKGTGLGTLIAIEGTGLSWVVKVDGYKGKPHSWHGGFWEVL